MALSIPRQLFASFLFSWALLALLPLSSPALCAAPDAEQAQRLKELESGLQKGTAESQELNRKAKAMAGELTTVRTQMVEAARAAQESESTLSEQERQLNDLTHDEKAKSEAMGRRREQMIGVLTALQRLAWRPSEALIAQPTSPADTVRSAILLRSAVPRIEDSARDLKAELDTLKDLRADILRQRQSMAIVKARLDAENQRTRDLFERKALLVQQTDAQAQEAEHRLTQMAREASDLRDLIVRLEEERKQREQQEAARQQAEREAREKARREAAQLAKAQGQPPPPHVAELPPPPDPSRGPQAPFTEAKGQMPFPARGQIVGHYGQTAVDGTVHKGILIATRPHAQVVAPHEGLIAFAGEFRGYGLLLIIEHGEGYHTLLAGMERIDGVVGQRLVAGEPVGVMGDPEGHPTLYMELRHDGQPTNPLPWLAARNDKVNG